MTEPYPPASELIMSSPRVGIAYAGEPWTSLPWRFYLNDTPFVSRR
ncbi:MAG: hypothetical protein HC821_03860 [Lewinella sp.]|nr:hypothetical protein [Lewinella sp.]